MVVTMNYRIGGVKAHPTSHNVFVYDLLPTEAAVVRELFSTNLRAEIPVWRYNTVAHAEYFSMYTAGIALDDTHAFIQTVTNKDAFIRTIDDMVRMSEAPRYVLERTTRASVVRRVLSQIGEHDVEGIITRMRQLWHRRSSIVLPERFGDWIVFGEKQNGLTVVSPRFRFRIEEGEQR